MEDTGTIHVGRATKRNNLEVPGKIVHHFFRQLFSLSKEVDGT